MWNTQKEATFFSMKNWTKLVKGNVRSQNYQNYLKFYLQAHLNSEFICFSFAIYSDFLKAQQVSASFKQAVKSNPFISSAWSHCKGGTHDGNMKLAFENCEFIGLESLAVSTCMLWSGETPMYIRCLYWTSTLLPTPLTQWTGTYFS